MRLIAAVCFLLVAGMAPAMAVEPVAPSTEATPTAPPAAATPAAPPAAATPAAPPAAAASVAPATAATTAAPPVAPATAATPAAPPVAATPAAPPVAATPVALPTAATPAAPTVAATPRTATACPGNPNALGTSRVLAISPDEFTRIGSMQYKQSLPLADHEVVITFDAARCRPTATSFSTRWPRNASRPPIHRRPDGEGLPWVLRRMYNEGHTIGTHSLDHPLGFERLRVASASSTRSRAASPWSTPLSATRKRCRRFSAFRALAAPRWTRASSPRSIW